MHREIDNLASIISDTNNLYLFDHAIFLFCGEKQIALRRYIGNKMGSSYFTSS